MHPSESAAPYTFGCDSCGMRWFVAVIAAVAVLLLTFSVLVSSSSDGPDQCSSAVGLRTLGTGENCQTLGVAVALPVAVLLLVLVAWGWKYLASRR